jgi:hypothetical protein
MATASIQLPIAAAQVPDNTTNNAAPALQVYKGTNSAPVRFGLRAAFDASTDEHLWWTFTMPDNYASGGTFRLLWAANTTSNAVVWGVSVGAVTAADADTYLEHAQATATTATTNVNATEARRVVESTVAPSMDSAAADDLVTVVVYRDANNGSDTCTVDAELLSVVLEYTTT